MIYGIISIFIVAGILIYLDLRISKIETYMKFYNNEINRLNFDLSNLRIKFENFIKGLKNE